ncbi:MAG TPA: glutamate--cysteine ligase [Candidatus Aveggerthella excrementigallinarum]|nr:glutamate--cysteine ligase [Candidatus Aveggerthella excrementigallinarum]
MNIAATNDTSTAPRADQSAREQNIQALVDYFERGVKASCENVGIELEHTIVKNEGLAPVSYSEEHGVRWILDQLRGQYPEALMDGDDLVGVARPGEAVTIEPAAQLEISAGPFGSLSEANAVLGRFEDTLEKIVGEQGMTALLLGYHPSAKATELELIPKRRYRFMNEYLGAIGPFGPRMMRGSAATQVSIDYHSVDDCLRKMRLASILTPLLSLISDNALRYEGGLREHYLVRTEIWNECDPDRCGLVPGVLDPDFSLRRYAEYVLDTPAILVPDAQERWRATSQTFGKVYAETPMERADVEHALSMFFNDVRLKTYVEIRPADAMPVKYAVAYAALIKGIFYSEHNLQSYLDTFATVTESDVADAKTALMQDGWNAEVYGRPVRELLEQVVTSAKLALSEEDGAFLEPLAALAFKGVSLAELAALEEK